MDDEDHYDNRRKLSRAEKIFLWVLLLLLGGIVDAYFERYDHNPNHSPTVAFEAQKFGREIMESEARGRKPPPEFKDIKPVF